MTDVLVLGGTGWLSGAVAREWLARGARVTVLARGSRPAQYGADTVTADRDEGGAYDRVADRDWDEVIDISSRPEHVAAALAALAPRARHWTYVSSVSVYAADDVAGADESAELAREAEAGDEYDYARAKAACEGAVRRALPHRNAIVRPGLIVGEGDPTDRFGYWVGRFALAGAGPVLVPDAPGAMVQVVDVEDLARFVADLGRERWTGAVNAVGDPAPLATMLAAAREAAAHTGDVVAVDPGRLVAAGVAYWAGPRSLPLWLPDDMPGFATRSNAAMRLLGGRTSPLGTTLVRTLADERSRGLDRERAAGLTRDEELELLADLA